MPASTRNLALIEGGSPESTADDLVGAVKRYIDTVVLPMRAELAVCKAELENLKARPEPKPGRDGLPGAPGPPGRDGRDGAPGQDGLGFDELHVLRNGEREITLEFVQGERVKRFPIAVPAVIYQGVYTSGKAYEPGDVVSFGGSGWHCNQPTDTKPGDGNATWTLAIKHGRDGRDGKDGAKGDRGPPGPPGKDLTHLGPDGGKW
jgi:hypothetical protein